MPERIGQQFGNYRLVRLLGQGGFADVYLGEHVHLNTYAAIKILHTKLAEDGMEDFRTEARTLAHLKHPNIVQVLDFGVDSMTPFLVMQYAPNGTLRQRHPRGIPVPLNIVISYVKQIAAALQYAHNQKFIHRDIKPENMLVGEQNQILLSDFGIAVVTASARAENPALAAGTWSPAGTVTYMAPEQIQGQTVPASDQYALAIVVYEWLTGAAPFTGTYMEVMLQQTSATPAPLREKNPAIPSDVEQVILTALHKDPQRRFGRIEVFAAALEQAARQDAAPQANAPSLTNGVQHSAITKEVSSMEAALVGPFGRTVIGPTRVTIGRAPDNMIVLSDGRVSSHHAEVRPEGGAFSIVDLGSSNGTFMNEQQITSNAPRLLQPDRYASGIRSLRLSWQMHRRCIHLARQCVALHLPPPASAGPAADYAGNTSYGYGMPEYGNYSEMGPSQPGQPGYMPQGQPSSPYVSETQMPTYISTSGQQPSYTPSQNIGQQPSYTPPQNTGQPPFMSAPQTVQQPSPSYAPTQLPAYTPPSPQPKRSPLRSIILAVIALVIILGGVATFLLIQHNQNVSYGNATATANTQAHNSATAAAQATNQAITQATAHANATTAAIVTSHYPPFTTSAFYDPLTNSSDTQWSTGTACQPTSTGYQVSIQQANTFQYCLHSGPFGDFAYRATMSIQQGDCGGLIFRYVDNHNYFLFEVCSNGTYNLRSFVNSQFHNLYTTDKASSAILPGSAQNAIAVTVQGNTVNMYVNGKNIDSATDTDLTNSTFRQGSIALMAIDSSTPTTVVYTNALVWS